MRRVVALATLALLAGCGLAGGGNSTSGGQLSVVAAEAFWGSLATQLGGDHVAVTNIVSDPHQDPHDYESSPQDARAFASADMVILNGAGYDAWAQKLLDANPKDGRTVLSVAGMIGKQTSDNPHFWYSPTYVDQVADQITQNLKQLAPSDATYFTEQRTKFATALRPYHDLITSIRVQFGGTHIAATESVFNYMSDALGLQIISPPAFMRAISEGGDPPVSSAATFQDQIQNHQVKLLIYNTQTVTSVTTNLKQLAIAAGVPVVGVSETMQPANSKFQDWQYAQLTALQKALKLSPRG